MASAIIATGKASIEINSMETEARFVFVPDSEGDGWDAAAVNKLASERNIRVQTDPKTLETFLSKASRAKTKDPMELVICCGAEPEATIGESVSWESLPVPADTLPYQEETLANAAPPEIFRIRTEKIKHEKKITKPGALPFMHAKEEVSVSWEKKESRESVEIDPAVKEVKYAGKGTKLGNITPAVPGKTGKNIFGRPISAQSAETMVFLFGKGISRGKNEISALVSGFVRIGENWADMVPLSRHFYTINTGIDGLTLFFNFQPGDQRFAIPAGSAILAEAAAMGAAADSLISEEKLDNAIAGSIKTGEPLEAFALSRSQNSEARVEINPEKTRAVLHLRKGLAGAVPLGMKAISQAINSSGVRGFDVEKLKADVKAFLEGKELELQGYLLAEGTPSTRGKDREIEILSALFTDDEKKPILARLNTWKEKDSLKTSGYDFIKAPGAAFVEKNAVVARVGSGSEGEAGKDIFGHVIPGLPGNDPDINLVRGLELHGSEIRAAKDGLLLMEASEKSFRAMVIDYQDARVAVRISDDAMEARGNLFREEGAGIQLTLENVKKVLAALGIKKGIDWEELEKACHLARINGSVSDYAFARGEAPLAKGASALKWLVPFRLPETEGGETSIQIKAGIPILELSEPVAAGRPGYDVKGTEIPIDRGSAAVIAHDDSIRELACGKGRRYVAARSGELKFDGEKLGILSAKTIEGNAEGNIKFSGEIRINGNVSAGSSIMGGSHISVNGFAEQSFISAGGKARVAMGFRGGGRGVLRARAGIEAAFVEYASVMAVGDIALTKGSIVSVIKTNGKLCIRDQKGKLSGGICQARLGVDTGDLGSEKGVRTEVSFGQDYLIKGQIATYEDETEKTKRILSEIEEKISMTIKKNLPLSDDLKNEKIRLVKLLEQYRLKLFTLREKFEEHYESEIRCRGVVFPGVVIESHDRYYEVKKQRSKVVFYFDRKTGSIKERSIE